jgi:hypothetical protein
VRSDAGHELRWLHVFLTSHSLLTDFETRIPFGNDKRRRARQMQIPSLRCGMTSEEECGKGNAVQTRIPFGNDKQKGSADADATRE